MMPSVSEAQRKWAFANKDKDTAEGRAAKEFANADKGGKLPERSKRAKKLYDRETKKKG